MTVKRFYSAREAADILGLSRHQADKLLKGGHLKGAKLPGCQRFVVGHGSLMEFMQANATIYQSTIDEITRAQHAA